MDLETWMTERVSRAPNATLLDTVIPGAHDACSYGITTASPDVMGAMPEWLRQALRLTNGREQAARWSKAQSLTIDEQLRCGVRYFDIRLCVHEGALWTCHGLCSVPWEPVVCALRAFADQHVGEVVVLDIHELYGGGGADGWSREQIAALCDDLARLFGPRVVPPSRLRDHLGDLHRDGLNVVLRSGVSWVGVEHGVGSFIPGDQLVSPWPETSSVPTLKSKLEAFVRSLRTIT